MSFFDRAPSIAVLFTSRKAAKQRRGLSKSEDGFLAAILARLSQTRAKYEGPALLRGAYLTVHDRRAPFALCAACALFVDRLQIEAGQVGPLVRNAFSKAKRLASASRESRQ